MSLEHSVFAVYGAELPGTDWMQVDEGLQQLRATAPDVAGDVQMYTVQDDAANERIVIGLAHQELPPGTCLPAGTLTPSPARDQALHAAAAALGHQLQNAPGWLLIHDLS